MHQIEIIIEGFSVNFEIHGPKAEGDALVICKPVASQQFSDTPQTKQVRIKTLSANVDWGIKSLHVQSSPTSVDFDVYSMDANDSRFWMAGDNACSNKDDGLPCCTKDEGCDLNPLKGNQYK